MIFIILIIHPILGQNGFRINLNMQIPLSAGQYVTVETTNMMNSSTKLIRQYPEIQAYLNANEAPRMDFLITSNESLLACYKNNVQVLQEISSCTQICNYSNFDMNLSQQGIQQYIENRSIYIIDNTQLPCQNGTYFQFLNPWISLGNLYIIDNSAYVAEAICEIILIAILLIEIMAVFVLYYKMRKQRRKIKRKTEKARGVAYRDSAKSYSGDYVELQNQGNTITLR